MQEWRQNANESGVCQSWKISADMEMVEDHLQSRKACKAYKKLFQKENTMITIETTVVRAPFNLCFLRLQKKWLWARIAFDCWQFPAGCRSTLFIDSNCFVIISSLSFGLSESKRLIGGQLINCDIYVVVGQEMMTRTLLQEMLLEWMANRETAIDARRPHHGERQTTLTVAEYYQVKKWQKMRKPKQKQKQHFQRWKRKEKR